MPSVCTPAPCPGLRCFHTAAERETAIFEDVDGHFTARIMGGAQPGLRPGRFGEKHGGEKETERASSTAAEGRKEDPL